MSTSQRVGVEATNGAALAAFLAGGVGALALALIVILNEVGIFAAPTLYGPAGGVTGRTALGTVAWLVAWAVLHKRWKDRQVDPGRVFAVTLGLIAVAVVLLFPPVWQLL